MTFSCDAEYNKAFEHVYRMITADCNPKESAYRSPKIYASCSPKAPVNHGPKASSVVPSGPEADVPAAIGPDPATLARLYENSMKTGQKRSSGVYYTSPEIVRFMCRDVLAHYLSNYIDLSYKEIYSSIQEETDMDPDMAADADKALENIRIFDPAAGCGAFVIGMLDETVRLRDIMTGHICRHKGQRRLLRIERHPFLFKFNAVRNSIYGADIDAAAVEITRLRLWHSLMSEYDRYRRDAEESGCRMTEPPGFGSFRCNIVCADSLFEYDITGFDAVIGNPPYISAVEAARNAGEKRMALKKKYPQLKGAFDIYTAFLLDGIRRTNEKGVYCWIVPNKLLVSQYAATVLEHLKKNGLMYSISVSDIGVFSGVGVYPVIITGNKYRAAVNRDIYAYTGDDAYPGQKAADNRGHAGMPKNGLKDYTADSFSEYGTCNFREYTADSFRHLIDRSFGMKPEMKTYETLADYGIKIASGAAGFQARMLQRYISENPYTAGDIGQQSGRFNTVREAIPFAVSGSIDKYCLRRGNVRYMGETYREPYIIKGDEISKSKWDLWCSEKICIAGLTREIEAYYSREPLALGVGVYAIYDFGGLEPLYLLALLNSSFMSWYLREKFHERHLSGGYLAINKFTLEQLPLAIADKTVQKWLALKAEKLLALSGAGTVENEAAALLNEIDETVYRLYDLDSAEIKIIRHIAGK